jgi:hypothetical protein
MGLGNRQMTKRRIGETAKRRFRSRPLIRLFAFSPLRPFAASID